MHFRTEVHLSKPEYTLEHHDPVFHIGSCFSEHIGNKFIESGFQGIVNPMGQQYNLHSMSAGLKRIISNKPYTMSELGSQGEISYSFDHHSDFSGNRPVEVLDRINSELQRAREILSKAKYIFITPGTSHYYIYKKSDKIVSNCHKIPASAFEMRMADAAENQATLTQIINDLKSFNAQAKIILTLSPVRYAALGFPLNTISKASLITALHQTISQFDHVYYFPSYEIMMDDLRDYRFYESDNIHPNEQAIAYIWEKYKHTFCSNECIKIMDEFSQLNRASLHRPRQVDTEAHQAFVRKNMEKLAHFREQYPYAPLNKILNRFETQLTQPS